MTGRGSLYFAATLSNDYKFFAASFTTNIIEKGNISQGYTDLNDVSDGFAASVLFSPNNQFYFSGTSGAVKVSINCNWNTSGNYYFNSNSNLC